MVAPIVLAVGRCAEPGQFEPTQTDKPTQPVTSFVSGRVLHNLYDGASVAFTVTAGSVEAGGLDGMASDVWVYRDGVLWQRCRVLPLTQEWGPDGESEVEVQAVSYKKLLDARHLQSDVSFTTTNQNYIVWALINHTQFQANGHLGIWRTGTAPGPTRDRSYLAGDNIGQRLNELSQVINGPFFDIGPDLQLTAKSWDQFATNIEPLVLGANARKMRRVPARFVNVSGAIGSTLQTVPEWRVSPAVTAILDVRGRWEQFDATHGSVTEQATVAEYAEANLAEGMNPPAAWTVELEPARYFGNPFRYEVGEFIQIVVPARPVDPLPVQARAQITEIAIDFTADGGTTVTLAAVEVTAVE